MVAVMSFFLSPIYSGMWSQELERKKDTRQVSFFVRTYLFTTSLGEVLHMSRQSDKCIVLFAGDLDKPKESLFLVFADMVELREEIADDTYLHENNNNKRCVATTVTEIFEHGGC